jgi:plastocyanin
LQTEGATPEASPKPGSGESVTVAIQDFAFGPPSLEIETGTTVVWRNGGQAPHTATALDSTFDTGQLDAGQEGRFTFGQPGRYDYRCDFHPQMQGTIVVI